METTIDLNLAQARLLIGESDEIETLMKSLSLAEESKQVI